ncbi:MAG: CPBP family intramembrane metalloprotease [Rudaea sp.]|nr:CPBP family intramembrane metalloprotease [Rudaea sp.]
MHIATWIGHLFTVSLLVVVPIVEVRYDRRLKLFTSSERRTTWYRLNILVLCVLAAAALALAYPVNIFVLANQGSVAAWLGAHPAVFLGATAMAVACTAVTLTQGFKAAVDRPFRSRIAKAMRSMRFMLPVTRRERQWWILVSLAAGVCEEILYRGFVTQYFSGSLGATISLGTVGAWLTASLFFGLAHAYQGVNGIVRSGLAGLLLGAIVILSGGLLIPIALHFLFDLQVLWMYRPMADEPDTAVQLIEGCEPSMP